MKNKKIEEILKILNKEFYLNLNWKEIVFKQLTYMECLEFIVQIETDLDLYKWIINFFNINLKEGKKITLKDLNIYWVDKVWDFLTNTAFKWFYDTTKKNKLKKIKEEWLPEWPFASYLLYLTKILKLDPQKILETYTPESLKEYTDAYVYNAREETDEWKVENIKRLLKKEDEGNEDSILKQIKERREIYKKAQAEWKVRLESVETKF